MDLSPAYLQQREEWKQEGRQEGRQEEQRLMITMLIEERFGTIDVELSGLVQDIVQLSASQRNRLLLDLSGLSREGLLKRLNKRIS